MMVVSTRKKEKSSRYGDILTSCGQIPSTLYEYINQYVMYERVESWRGPRTNLVNPFDVKKFSIDEGQWDIWVCSKIPGYQVKGTGGIFHLIHWLVSAGGVDYAGLQPGIAAGQQDFWSWDGTFNSTYDSMKAELFGKVNEARFNSSVFLFELGETLAYLRDLFKGLAAIFNNTYRFSQGMERVRMPSPEELWLQYRYAILPLILTISDAIVAFKGQAAKQKVQNYSKNEFKYTHRSAVYPFGLACYFDVRSVYTVKCGGAIWIESQCDPAPFGTGVWDVLAGAWEKTRLSFVFDWLLDVGAWLASIRNTNLVVKESYGTKVIDVVKSVSFADENPYWELIEMGDPVAKGYSMKREIDISPPLLPVVQLTNANWRRQVDAISLIIAGLKAFLRKR